jgi:coenzyme Q-binding protein COQ10
LTFRIRFELRSKLLNSLMGMLFNDAARNMVAAFEGRAKQLYRVGRSVMIRPGASGGCAPASGTSGQRSYTW